MKEIDKKIHKKSNKKIDKKSILYIVLILVLILFIILFLIRVHQHYSIFKNHEKYFEQANPKIESWMTVNVLIKYFNISTDSLTKELKIKNNFQYQRLTIDRICRKNHLNCTEVVNNFNLLKS